MVTADHEESPGALEGIRVLDVATPLGAYVSRIFGDLGADVIKIEPPEGDPSRHVTPVLLAGSEPMSLPFLHANLNKRSIILDLQQPQDQARFRALATQADVVVSTESTATWATRGVDLSLLSRLYESTPTIWALSAGRRFGSPRRCVTNKPPDSEKVFGPGALLRLRNGRGAPPLWRSR